MHFRNDRAADGYAEPAMYQVQYFKDGVWTTIPRQAKTPAAPAANYNRIDPAHGPKSAVNAPTTAEND